MFLKSISRHPSTVAYRARIARMNPAQVQGARSTQKFRFLNVAAGIPVPRKRKVWDSVDEAIKDVKSGDTLLSGGPWVWILCVRRCRIFLSPLPRIRTLRNPRYSHWGPCEEEGRQKPHCCLEQRWSWRTWAGCVRSDRSCLVLGPLNALSSLFFLRQALICWVSFQDDCLLHWRQQTLRVSLSDG